VRASVRTFIYIAFIRMEFCTLFLVADQFWKKWKSTFKV